MATAHIGHEVGAFHHQLGNIQPPIGVLVTPSELAEFRINGPLRTQHFWVDPLEVGDVLGLRWGVFMCTSNPLTLSTVGYAAGMTIAAKYVDIDEEASMSPPGTLRKYAIPCSIVIEQEIIATDQSRRFRIISRNIQLAVQRMHDAWQQDIYAF